MNFRKTKFSADNIRAQHGKNILITGGNSGLGFETAKVLVSKGANVTIACRNEEKGELAKKELEHLGSINLKILDLESMASIHSFCDEVIKENKPLDVLINNAGVMSIEERTYTEDGFETQMAVNYFGHFTLTTRLLPLLEKSEEARVVSVSSVAAYNTKMDLGNLNSEKYYGPFKTYKQTKLANLLFANELGWRYPWIVSVAAHPGVCRTKISRNMDAPAEKSFAVVQKCIGHKVERAALPILYAATKTNLTTGAYFGPEAYSFGAVSKVRQPKAALNMELAEKLWEITKQLVS